MCCSAGAGHLKPAVRQSSSELECPVVVAMAVVGMMQVSGDQVVDVVSVRHRLVSAAGPVGVAGLVPATIVIGRASGRVGVVDRN